MPASRCRSWKTRSTKSTSIATKPTRFITAAAKSSSASMAKSPTGWTTFLALPGVGRKTANIVLGNGFRATNHRRRHPRHAPLAATRTHEEYQPRQDRIRSHAAGAGKAARTVLPSSAIPRTARLLCQEPSVSSLYDQVALSLSEQNRILIKGCSRFNVPSSMFQLVSDLQH